MSDQNTSGNAAGAAAAGQQQATGRQLLLQKIYVKDLSFESPNAPQVFASNPGEPRVDFNLKSSTRAVDDSHWEVLLTLTVNAKGNEDRSLFLVEVQQAGIFQLAGYTEEERRPILGSYCPGVLYPYAREAISDLVTRGGFPQLLLQPINFDAVYQQSMAQAAQQQGQPEVQTQGEAQPQGDAQPQAGDGQSPASNANGSTN